MPELTESHCKPCTGQTPPVSAERARTLLAELDGWTLSDDGKSLHKTFKFKNYYETLAFVNGTAVVSHREDHHPDLVVGYNKVEMTYSTHAIGGLSDTKIDALTRL
ncbi:MAG TPA: 4a-hydroxytetrahydrobiopterin dehydratase [Tepidisphaeraceae bacterium]|nr:4a-hydroxytetrahydrobiopterin dehydratase [Tepidisphaeraceae bacterium]